MKTRFSKLNTTTAKLPYLPSLSEALRLCVALIVLATCTITQAAGTNDITSLVQRGLFEEEANHNLDAAMQSYENAIKLHDKDRKLAATAVFRLGECYRKQGKTNEANVFYKRIITEFADQSQLVEASRPYVGNVANADGKDGFRERARQNFALDKGQTKGADQGNENDVLRANLRSLQLETAQAEALWQHAKQLGGDELVNFFTTIQPDQLVIDLDRQRMDARSKLQVLATQYGDQHPEYKAQEKIVQTATERLFHRADTVAWGIEQRYKMLNEQEGALKKQLDADARKSAAATTSEEDQETQRIKEMIQNSPDLINVAISSDEGTPLQKAAVKGQFKVAEFLLANGANPNVRTDQVSPPLICAAVHGHKAVVDLLLSKGADIEIRSTKITREQTALMCAAARGFKTVAETLLAHGANVNAKDNTGRSTLHCAAENNCAVAALLIANKADVNAKMSDDKTPLHVASEFGNSDVVKVLLDHGADVNAKSNGGFTPLLDAAQHEQLGVARLLLEHGANVEDAVADDNNQADFRGFRPINFAISHNDPKFLKVLLEHHANPNSTSATLRGVTPLLMAARPEITEMLLDHGADPNHADENGTTPVLMATINRHKQSVAMLIAHGANVNATDKQGTPPIAYVRGATKGDTADIRQMLLKAGANENDIRLKQISVSRRDRSKVIFTRGTNDWNHYTLIELLSVLYGNNQPPRTFSAGQPSNVSFSRGPLQAAPPPRRISTDDLSFAFPDLSAVTIRGINTNAQTRVIHLHNTDIGPSRVGAESVYHIDVEKLLQSTNSAEDVQLQWGDVVEIPEPDHPIDARWNGLSRETCDAIVTRLQRTVELKIKSSSTNLTVTPPMPRSTGGAYFRMRFGSSSDDSGSSSRDIVSSFGLREVIGNAAILRSSSDTSRIKVARHNHGNVSTFTVDLHKGEEPWVEAGDVIEIPDLDTANAAADQQTP